MSLIRYSLVTAAVTSVPWIIYLTPWDATLASLSPWAPWVTVVATALSPLIAVQVTRKLDRDTERRRERVGIFQALMAYRKAQLESLEFCRALSLVDVVFDGASKAERLVVDSLNAYQSEFSKNFEILTREQRNSMSDVEISAVEARNRALSTSRTDALNTMLHSIAECLDMNVSHQSIANNGVWPDWVGKQIAAHRDGAQANVEASNFFTLLSAQIAAIQTVQPTAADPPSSPAEPRPPE